MTPEEVKVLRERLLDRSVWLGQQQYGDRTLRLAMEKTQADVIAAATALSSLAQMMAERDEARADLKSELKLWTENLAAQCDKVDALRTQLAAAEQWTQTLEANLGSSVVNILRLATRPPQP